MLDLTYDKQKVNELLTIGYLSGTLSIMQTNSRKLGCEASSDPNFSQTLNSLKTLLNGKIPTAGIDEAEDVRAFVLSGFESDREATALILIVHYYLLYEKMFREAANAFPENKERILQNGYDFVLNGMFDLPLEYVEDDASMADMLTNADTFEELLQEIVAFAK